MRTVFSLVFGMVLLSVSTVSAAPILLVDGSSHLTGATGVDVGGLLYDVTFMDGSCVDVFNGCSSSANFTFTNATTALLATQALSDDVFIDGGLGQFDSTPTLTAGCSITTEPGCHFFTPYGVNGAFLGHTDTVYFSNLDSAGTDSIHNSSVEFSFLFTGSNSLKWAVWQPSAAVPEPSTILLLAAGLAGILGYGWRRKRAA